MTKEEMFDWIVDNKAEILRHPPMKWIRPDNTEFFSEFCFRSNNTQWPAFETLQEVIEFAAKFEEGRK